MLLLTPALLQAQADIDVTRGFISELVTPLLLRDAGHVLTIDSLQSELHEAEFQRAGSPYMTFGFDQARLWIHFTVENHQAITRTYILRLNRKSFNEFILYQKTNMGPVMKIGEVGLSSDEDRFFLVNGYFFGLTLEPGKNEFWARMSNEIGSMHLGLSVHSQENYAVFSRQTSLVYGVFIGFMLLSLFISLVMFYYYRDALYPIYIAFIVTILLREAYFNTADFDISPVFQRHCTTILIAATYAALYRRFLQVWQYSRRFNFFLKCYSWAALATAISVWVLAEQNQGLILKYVFLASNVLNLVFMTLAFFFTLRLFRTLYAARVLVIGSLPLAAAFTVISLRNMGLIPSYPFLQFVVEAGFILEVLMFSIAFIRWYRYVQEDRDLLRLKISVEQREKQLAIQSAEQRVKDRIARDLHDDVAASMSGIRILSQVAYRQFGEKVPEAAALLLQITRSAQATVDSIGDIIWAIKPHPDYLNDMADRMREYATKMFDALEEMDCRLDIPRTLPALELEVEARRNVYLIFKEAVNNVLKHSQSTRIDISMHLEATQLVLRIDDNGVGFDTFTVKHGHGLDNMARRAQDIGGDFQAISKPGAGTHILFTLPVKKEKTHP